jgi:hypothetical protein
VPKFHSKSKLNLFIRASLLFVPIFTFRFRLGGTLVLVASLFIWFFWARKQTYEVSQYQRQGAEALYRDFSGGEGRKAASRINHLAYEFLEEFKSKFAVGFGVGSRV